MMRTLWLLKKKPLVEEFLEQTPFSLSAFSFVNIFIWSDFFHFVFKMIDHQLCIFAQNTIGSFFYLPPLGRKMTHKAIKDGLSYLSLKNNGNTVTRIEHAERRHLKLFPEKDFFVIKRSKEFIYNREDIVGMTGNRFKSKRSLYNQFIKNHSFEFLPYASDMEKDCLSLYDLWAQERKLRQKDDMAVFMIEENRLVHQKAIHYYQDLNLMGRVVRINNQIVAYSFGFELKPDVFCILFEIVDLHFKGLSTFIFRAFCMDQQVQKYRWINAMDGCGLSNIEKAKQLFRPHHTIESYCVSPRRIGHVF